MGAAVDKVFASCLLTGFILSLLLSSSAARFFRFRLPFRLPFRLRFPWSKAGRMRFRVHRPRTGAQVSAATSESGRPDISGNPPWLVPLVMGTLTTMFGASGLAVRSLFQLSPVTSVIVAVMCGTASSAFAVWSASRLLAETAVVMTGNPIFLTTGHVTLSIPEGGIGAIAYVIEGRRVTMPARSKTGGSLHQGTQVIIVDLDGKVAVVEES